MQENTLFYSKFCTHCKSFIIDLKRNDLLNYFTKKICIDDPQIRRNLPPFLKEVPTIIVQEYDQPIASDIAFKWITYKIKEIAKAKHAAQMKSSKKQSNVCVPGDIECFSFGGTFDNAGGLSDIGDSLKPTGVRLDGEGKTIETSINYESFTMIKPEQMQLDGQGKTVNTSIDYSQFSLSGGNDMPAAAVNSGGSGGFDKDLEKLQKMREMDNDFFGNDGKVRQ